MAQVTPPQRGFYWLLCIRCLCYYLIALSHCLHNTSLPEFITPINPCLSTLLLLNLIISICLKSIRVFIICFYPLDLKTRNQGHYMSTKSLHSQHLEQFLVFNRDSMHLCWKHFLLWEVKNEICLLGRGIYICTIWWFQLGTSVLGELVMFKIVRENVRKMVKF